MNTNWTQRYLLGTVDGKNIYLSPPKFDCGRGWGFGHLGNNNCHYHLNNIGKNENICFRDALLKHFDAGTHIFKCDNLTWTFCELVLTAYSLKETAEVLGRGGSHMSNNPCKNIITNKEETARINNIVLPAIFEEINNILIKLNAH